MDEFTHLDLSPGYLSGILENPAVRGFVVIINLNYL